MSGDVALVGDATRNVSILGRVDIAGDVDLGKTVGGVGGLVVGKSLTGAVAVEEDFLLQKDSRPPLFLSLARSVVAAFSSGSCLRSHPHSSFATAFWAFTDFSQSVDPLDA